MRTNAGSTYVMDTTEPMKPYSSMVNAALIEAICEAVFTAIRKYIPEFLLDAHQKSIDDDILASVSRFFPNGPCKHKVDNVVLFVGAKCIAKDTSELTITQRKDCGVPLFLGEFRDGSTEWYTINGKPEDPQKTPPHRLIFSVLNSEDAESVAVPSRIDIKLFVGAECEIEDGSIVKVVDYVDTPQDRMCDQQNSGRFIAVRLDGLGEPLTFNLLGKCDRSGRSVVRVISGNKE